jgi:hypothetical protein
MISIVTRTASALITLMCILGSLAASAAGAQPQQPAAGAKPPLPQMVECVSALSERCPDNSLFRQLPELMAPSDNGAGESQLRGLPQYRELQVLPQPTIVPAPHPILDDPFLERRPGDLG